MFIKGSSFKKIILTILLTIFGIHYLNANTISFQDWLAGVKAEARKKGISEKIIHSALDNLTPIPSVIKHDKNQPEFKQTFQTYFNKRISSTRIKNGRKNLARNFQILRNIDQYYKVQARFIVAIWGVESNFGNYMGNYSVIRALATLAYDPRRSSYFRQELFHALKILQDGHTSVDKMVGGWAGAMGQSQFMPSSFLSYAQDFDKDGRIDIWNSKPDSLASIAYYLKKHGWQYNYTWGRQVTLPKGFNADNPALQQKSPKHGCKALNRHSIQLPLDKWQELGLRKLNGKDLPKRNNLLASLILPDGKDGPAFLTYPNYRVLLKYNCTNHYALSLGVLSDKLKQSP